MHSIISHSENNNATKYFELQNIWGGGRPPLYYGPASHNNIQCFINFVNISFKTTCVPASVLYTYATQTNRNNSTTLQAAIMYTVVVNYL